MSIDYDDDINGSEKYESDFDILSLTEEQNRGDINKETFSQDSIADLVRETKKIHNATEWLLDILKHRIRLKCIELKEKKYLKEIDRLDGQIMQSVKQIEHKYYDKGCELWNLTNIQKKVHSGEMPKSAWQMNDAYKKAKLAHQAQQEIFQAVVNIVEATIMVQYTRWNHNLFSGLKKKSLHDYVEFLSSESWLDREHYERMLAIILKTVYENYLGYLSLPINQNRTAMSHELIALVMPYLDEYHKLLAVTNVHHDHD